ncbi:MAG: hypothetical protein ABFD92_16335 [Planctomycetaceae bacterium]|nr:hypothetical protein [Planctomycetaceae bacterium]
MTTLDGTTEDASLEPLLMGCGPTYTATLVFFLCLIPLQQGKSDAPGRKDPATIATRPSHSPIEVRSYTEFPDESGQIVARLLILRLPMPNTLTWNTKDFWERAATANGDWVGSRAKGMASVLRVDDNLYWSGPASFWHGPDGPPDLRVVDMHAPATHYDLAFVLPYNVILSGRRIEVYSKYTIDPLTYRPRRIQVVEDLKPYKPTGMLLLTKDMLESCEAPLSVGLNGTASEASRFYGGFNVNLLHKVLSWRSIAAVRVGQVESTGPMVGEEKRGIKDNMGFLFLSQPQKDAPIFLRLIGLPVWLKAQPRLAEGARKKSEAASQPVARKPQWQTITAVARLQPRVPLHEAARQWNELLALRCDDRLSDMPTGGLESLVVINGNVLNLNRFQGDVRPEYLPKGQSDPAVKVFMVPTLKGEYLEALFGCLNIPTESAGFVRERLLEAGYVPLKIAIADIPTLRVESAEQLTKEMARLSSLQTPAMRQSETAP